MFTSMLWRLYRNQNQFDKMAALIVDRLHPQDASILPQWIARRKAKNGAVTFENALLEWLSYSIMPEVDEQFTLDAANFDYNWTNAANGGDGAVIAMSIFATYVDFDITQDVEANEALRSWLTAHIDLDEGIDMYWLIRQYKNEVWG